ncbi:DUF6894 family protein [Teichococcus vastitatis]|uniref:DUF6894 domain-containing protein n=1 Tax=Teichococcus vastitatis TaxID=2307076 RepID=A0ABS9W3T1_9PROT|nr:hypothetical protein [Pseudoroseomonas vastitatis]MCI0753525.1 hypothetical protein [Pseudoroseomonas vastitatis]
MERFFFDFKDAGLSFRDDEGAQFSSRVEGRNEALCTLAELAKGRMCGGDVGPLAIDMRDESGRVLFTAWLHLDTRWTH